MHQHIPLDQIDESPSNPRKSFDEDALAELAESIKQHGVIQPVMVRRSKDKRYELVFGARRFRASKIADLAEIPAQIRELDDDVVLELQLIENDKRSDITPLEEADGFARLVGTHGREIADIAARLGRPDEYVRRRLLLAHLIEPLRELLDARRIGIGSAELLAALPTDSQRELAAGELAGEQCFTKYDREQNKHVPDPDSPRTWNTNSVQWAIREISRDLSGAQWSLDDDTLGDCRACTGCPDRTDHQATLFDTGAGARCLDGTCWASKLEAWTERRRQQIADAGEELVEGDDVLKIVSNRWDPRRRYRCENDVCDELVELYTHEDLDELEEANEGHPVDVSQTWGQVAPDAPRTWVIRDSGRIEGYIRLEDAISAIADYGFEDPHDKAGALVDALRELIAPPGTSAKAKKREAEKAEQRAAAEADAVEREQEILRIVELVSREGLRPVTWLLHQAIVATEASSYYERRHASRILSRRLGEPVDEGDAADEWPRVIEQLEQREVAAITVEWLLRRFATPVSYDVEAHHQKFQDLVSLVDWSPEVDAQGGAAETPESAAETPTSPYQDERLTSPEAAELYEYVTTHDRLMPGRLEQHNVKVLREVLRALAGSLNGATTKTDLVREILAHSQAWSGEAE